MTSFVKKLQAVTFALLVSFTSLLTAAQTRPAPYNPPARLGYGFERAPRPAFDLNLWQRLIVPPPVHFGGYDSNRFAGRGASSSVHTRRNLESSIMDECDLTARPKHHASSIPRSGRRR